MIRYVTHLTCAKCGKKTSMLSKDFGLAIEEKESPLRFSAPISAINKQYLGVVFTCEHCKCEYHLPVKEYIPWQEKDAPPAD